MITIQIPGFGNLKLAHLVLDYNGTLAVDGQLLPGVTERLAAVSKQLGIHVITADTFGTVQAQMAGHPCEVVVLPSGDQREAKRHYVSSLGAARVVAVGNGRNDQLMLQTAALGIAVMQAEGTAVGTLMSANIVVASITAALDLLLNPSRLTATLRG